MFAFYTNAGVLAVLAAISALALNVLIGETGIFSAAQAVFYGLGAYTAALVGLHVSSSLPLSALAGMVVAGLAALVFAIPAVRVRGDYFIVASFAFSVIMTTVFSQWTSVTGGNAGISGVPEATIGPLAIAAASGYLAVAVVFLVLTCGALYVILRRAPVGRMLRAVRDDEVAVMALGKSPAYLRLIAVVVAGVVSGLAGVVYAYFVSFVDPSGFGFSESILFVTMVIFGGVGSLAGPLIGALVVGFGIPSLGLLNLPSSVIGPLQQIVVGMILIVLMVFYPGGLAAVPEGLMRRVPGRGQTASSTPGTEKVTAHGAR